MKRKLKFAVLSGMLIAVLAVLFGIGAMAQPAPNGNALWFASYAQTEPTLDGEIDEIWSTTVAMPFETESYGYIKALWRKEKIYLLAELHNCTQIDFLLSTRFYNNTSAGTWTWGGNYGLTCTPTTDSTSPDYQATAADFITATWNGWVYKSDINKTATKAEVRSKATETGFIVEVMIPLSSKEYQKNGSFMGLGAFVNGDYSVGNCVGIATTDREDALGLKKSPYALYEVATYTECPHKQYREATCLSPATCLGCGKTQGEPNPANHAAEAAWVITDEKHSLVYPCCHAVVSEAEHSWGEVTVDIEPTCTQPGESSRHCTVCDARPEVTGIPALGHDFSEQFTQDVAPTCTDNGSESRHCSRCDEVTDVRRIDALGHDPGDWTVIRQATCSAPGMRNKTCKRCWTEVEVETVTVPHTAGEWIVDKEAQPGVAGSRHHVCTVCNEVFDREEIPALPVEPKDSGGCGSMLPVSAWTVGVMLLPAIVAIGRKRKKETET